VRRSRNLHGEEVLHGRARRWGRGPSGEEVLGQSFAAPFMAGVVGVARSELEDGSAGWARPGS